MIKIGNFYHKFEKIGKGSYSTVFKGYNKKNKNNYAIKVIDIEKNKSNINRFYLEIQLMKRLNHKNIIKLYDTHENDKYIYIIMEFCKYGDLRQFINKKPLNEYKTQIIMRQIINGLEYLYNNKVFHRDLKPQNILVSNNCIVKITDFGLAKEYEENILSDTICGSPIYMAPEILQNNKYDNKADIWSLGVIFYELLTGKTPFNVKKYDDLIYSIKNKEIIIPESLKITHNARDLLEKLLVKISINRITWKDIFIHPWIKINMNNSILFKSKIKNINKKLNPNPNTNTKSISNFFKNNFSNTNTNNLNNNTCSNTNINSNNNTNDLNNDKYSNSDINSNNNTNDLNNDTYSNTNINSNNNTNDSNNDTYSNTNINLNNNTNDLNNDKYSNSDINSNNNKYSNSDINSNNDKYSNSDINLNNDNKFDNDIYINDIDLNDVDLNDDYNKIDELPEDECIFSMEIDNYNKVNNNNNSFYNNSYNETVSTDTDLAISSITNNKYDLINESFSKYDETLEYIQTQNKKTVVNKLQDYLNNSTLFVKSFIIKY